jgi:hypothetical protein
MNGLDVPLVFVPGNHDPDVSGYRQSRAGVPLRAGLSPGRCGQRGALNADGMMSGSRAGGVTWAAACATPRAEPAHRRAVSPRRVPGRARWQRLRGCPPVDVPLTHPRRPVTGRPRPGAPRARRAARAGRRWRGSAAHGHVLPHEHHRQPPPCRTEVRNATGRHPLDISPGHPPARHQGAGGCRA